MSCASPWTRRSTSAGAWWTARFSRTTSRWETGVTLTSQSVVGSSRTFLLLGETPKCRRQIDEMGPGGRRAQVPWPGQDGKATPRLCRPGYTEAGVLTD